MSGNNPATTCQRKRSSQYEVRTWQYVNVGSNICFHVEVTAASSSFEMPPVRSWASLVLAPVVLNLSCRAGGLTTPSVPALGLLISLSSAGKSVALCGSVTAASLRGGAKNVARKEYSAVALSIRTSSTERNSASTGSFCTSHHQLTSNTLSRASLKTHVCFDLA